MIVRRARETEAAASLPTRHGDLEIHVFRLGDETEVVALVHGEIGGDEPVLVRLHSECLTGEALGSLRCDCGEQLELGLEQIGRAERGVLLYLRHEGRGIGLFDKIRAYALQDRGLDTVDANVALGLPIDGRDYAAAAAVLQRLGVRRTRVLTNNPAKLQALAEHGIEVVERVPIEALPNPANLTYLRTKARRMGHLLAGEPFVAPAAGHNGHHARPTVTVHWAQTIDGRIAARTGDAHWVSGESSLRLAHELRAVHDAVMVGIGTVLADDPRLTVRLVEGRSPIRVIVDSKLRVPIAASVLADRTARTIIATTPAASEERARAIRASGGEIVRAHADDSGAVDLADLLRRLRGIGIGSLLIEGGRGIITSALRDHLVDRLTVCIAPKVIGEGVAAVGDLQIDYLRQALTFARARFVTCGEDLVFYGEPQWEGTRQSA
ncbi:MAG TPA: GTP cyclohydrolase II [Candidatus Limnocylindria bacterium]|nr:GTP cyclohydrolase II [Candidatus Limnocylindria bacterium]